MTGGRDPRRTVHIDAHVPLLGKKRRSGVHSHPNADRAFDKGLLTRASRLEPVPRRLEHEEERVALGIHLHPATSLESSTKRAPMLRQRVRIRPSS